MDRLEQIGIQRWRVRREVSVDDAAVLIDASIENAAPDNTQASEPSHEASSLVQQHAVSVDPIVGVGVDPAPKLTQAAKQDPTPAPTVSPIRSAVINTCPPATDLNPSDLSRHSWQDLENLLASGTLCDACARQNSILGEGDPSADLIIVLAAPCNDDANSSGLLGGRAAKLFDAILQALGRDRQSVYLTTVAKCATSNNPISNEAASINPIQSAQCSSIVSQQLALLSPKIVIALGESTAQSVLRTNHSLHELRATENRLATAGVAVVASHDLGELLDQPSLKSALWGDLKRCFEYV